MPMLKIDHVVSFSSEDPVHTANNLLSPDPAKKWKCKSPGEKSAIVVLQLEKASVISGIDIGNENSAYIEILVTRSGMGDDFKVLLVMSSLMSPLEARQSTNINRVRMFNKDHLSKPECEQKWDRVKIVCTQPFNRHVQYGLSFITFHTSDSDTPSQTAQTIGKFTLRPPSPDTFSAGNLFSRRKEEEKNEPPPSAAAAIRKADHSDDPIQKPKLDVTEKLKKKADNDKESQKTSYNYPKSRNNVALLYDEEEQKIAPSTSKAKEKETEKTRKHKNEDDGDETESKPKKAKRTPSKNSEASSTSRKKHNGLSDRPHPPKRAKVNQTKPFNRLLEGVMIVISGIQNPDRADLRSKALSMGAKYSGDWNDRCTHLICAFPNTPKFNQVRGKGKIVTRKWIEDCHSQRKRLPWRRYCLDKNDKGQDESEEEICEAIEEENSGNDTDVDDHADVGSDTEERVKMILEKKNNDLSKGDCGVEETVKEIEKEADIRSLRDSSEERQVKKGHSPETVQEDDVYSAETDLETENPTNETKVVEPVFGNFFDNNKFFIDTRYDKDMYLKLVKYITAYKGIIIDDPTEEIDVYITDDPKPYGESEMVTTPRISVKPDWVWECHNQQCHLPFDDYLS